MALQRLKGSCRRRLKELSSAQTTKINLPFITVLQMAFIWIWITRARFDQLTDLVDRSIEPMKKAMANAGGSLLTSLR